VLPCADRRRDGRCVSVINPLTRTAPYKGLFLVFLRVTLPKTSIDPKLKLYSESSRNYEQVDIRVTSSESFRNTFKIGLKSDYFAVSKKTDGKNDTSANSDSKLSVADLQEMNAMVDLDQNADIGAAIAVRNLAVFRSLSFYLYSHVRFRGSMYFLYF
jgi:hypothetical protein